MKHLPSLLVAAFLMGAATLPANAAVHVSIDFFHDNLESYGDWKEVGNYGYCWQPRDVDSDWRPYSDGHWVYTDAGWTWDSDEPYSWAVYHYGRWAKVDRVGWVWVPGTEWGPAWVSWRRSPRHVGWAPLPPEAEFSRSIGFSTRVDTDYDIGPTNYSFVEVRDFGAPRLRSVIVEPRRNITIINQTTNITKVTYVNNVVYNGGPQYDVISRESAQPIRRLKLDRRQELDADPRSVRAEQLQTRVDGDSFRVVALPVDATPATAPKKLAAKVPASEIDRGWKNAGPPAEVAKVRTKIKSETAAPAESPAQPPVHDSNKRNELHAAPGAPVIIPSDLSVPAREEKPSVSVQPANGQKPATSGKNTKALPPQAAPLPVSDNNEHAVKPEPAIAPIPPKKGNAKDKAPAVPLAPVINQTEVPLEASASHKKNPKGNKLQHAVVEAAPQAPVQAPEPTAKQQTPAAMQPAQAAVPKVHHDKGEAGPKPAQPAVRNNEPEAPKAPEPKHVESRPPTVPAPVAAKPQAPQQAQQPQKAKGKGKGKDERKADSVPQ